jgi:hypothetical protein
MTYARSKECTLSHNGLLGSNPTLEMNISVISLCVYKGLAKEWSPNQYVPSDIYKSYLEIPETEYLEQVNGMDQHIMLAFWQISPAYDAAIYSVTILDSVKRAFYFVP